ncbi:hypothetical protein DPMN_170691 [Dreissena polymorpha]|uniref:Uncharacterized protein n=1 Tax=Dreissena polymorpha TaxID=45954 RepID=A0A9D4DYB3_DREPO|nr:hypothetical protein DPMN_170691 [Dreissena polymorpha]
MSMKALTYARHIQEDVVHESSDVVREMSIKALPYASHIQEDVVSESPDVVHESPDYITLHNQRVAHAPRPTGFPFTDNQLIVSK